MVRLAWVLSAFGIAFLGVGCSSSPRSFEESLDPMERAALDVRRRADPVGGLRSGVDGRDSTLSELQIRRAFRAGEVTLGMTPDEVVQVWGKPREIQVAGDAHSGNQKWIYFNGLSESWSLETQKIVYFEGGRVAGWDTGQTQP